MGKAKKKSYSKGSRKEEGARKESLEEKDVNVSSEFSCDLKTIINKIISSTETLISSKSNSEKSELQLIHNNANLLLDKVGQLEKNNTSNTEIHQLQKTKELVLIIEDDEDLRMFLKSQISKSYEVYESNGIAVEDKILEIIPDIIICDLNLPQKNGFEICEYVKNDERTSHIPVLMLTSLNSDETHIKSLKSGVDMFLTKPFNFTVLSESIETLLYNRKKVQKYFEKNSLSNSSNKEEHYSNKEIKFVRKMNEIIYDSLDDSSFSVEILAEKLHISRVQLYRKTKAVLGITISDYIQNIRLNKSKELLLANNNLSIADIAYSVGFSSPNYFSTAFKGKFNKKPKDFRKL